MSINQHELAEALGVSQYTVSVALGGKGRVSEKTRQRVLAAAEKMGYRVNPLAAALRGAKTSTIGIVWHFVEPWAGDAMIALDLLERLQKRGYTVYQAQQSEDPELMCQQLDGFLDRQVDAVLVRGTPGQLMYPGTLKRLKSGTPFLALCREDLPDFPGDLLIHDRDQSIRQVVEHLAATGRKKPCFALSLAQESNPPKFHVFEEACKACGIAHPKMLLDLDYPTKAEETGVRHERAMDRCFPDQVDVDAIFAFSDVGAMYIMHALRKRGLRVPEDVAVVGFNDIQPARVWDPPLASGDRKFGEVADVMEKMLMQRFEDPKLPPLREAISMEFIWRESAGGDSCKALSK